MRVSSQIAGVVAFCGIVAASDAHAKEARYELCTTKAIIMPAKMTGDPWDSGGKKQNPGALRAMAQLAMTGGLSALESAGTLSSILQGGSGAPDIYVRMSFNKKLKLRTNRVFNALNPQWGSTADSEGCHLKRGETACSTCVALEESEIHSMIDIEVIDEDAMMNDPVGRATIPQGVPAEAIQSGLWAVPAFDHVLVFHLSVRAL